MELQQYWKCKTISELCFSICTWILFPASLTYTDVFDIFCAISIAVSVRARIVFQIVSDGIPQRVSGGIGRLADSVPDGTNCVLWWRGSWHPLMPPNYFICPIWLSPSNISLMESFHVGDNKSMLLSWISPTIGYNFGFDGWTGLFCFFLGI